MCVWTQEEEEGEKRILHSEMTNGVKEKGTFLSVVGMTSSSLADRMTSPCPADNASRQISDMKVKGFLYTPPPFFSTMYRMD